ncbi:unnamed protein product [Rotaria sp. Silwood1]|nr:unnamed protein product [Rotaria sp. Silwood1]
MRGGSSGGPWLQGFNLSTLRGYQSSVNSHGYAFAPMYMFGPRFDQSIKALYDEMEVVAEPTSINNETAIGFKEAISLTSDRTSMICPASGTALTNGANLLLLWHFFQCLYMLRDF